MHSSAPELAHPTVSAKPLGPTRGLLLRPGILLYQLGDLFGLQPSVVLPHQVAKVSFFKFVAHIVRVHRLDAARFPLPQVLLIKGFGRCALVAANSSHKRRRSY